MKPTSVAKLSEVADGVVAFVQGAGSWGLSNSGLIVGESQSLLVDTFFDLAHTRRLLEAYRGYNRELGNAPCVVNTHANGDHCYGNALLRGSRIIASNGAAREMRTMPPTKLATLMRAAKLVTSLGAARFGLGRVFQAVGLRGAADFMDAAPYVCAAFQPFEFRGIDAIAPTETFDGTMEIDLGGKRVVLMEVGPAHTEGDVVAFVPETKTLFSGDLLFEGLHPLVWAGTITGYIQALERLLELEPAVIVPGHGAVTDRSAIVRHIDYMRALRSEAEPLYRSGASAEQAAMALIRRGFGRLSEPERLVVNVTAAYREFAGTATPLDVIGMFAAMARLARDQVTSGP